MLKIVPDTNVLVSAFITEGNESKLFGLAREGKIKLIISSEILDEFNDVIKRDKFGLTQEEIVDFNTQLIINVDIVHPKIKLKVVKDDPSDNKILECAVEGKADYLVSGDKHLLRIKKFRGIRIVNAKEFLEKIK